MKLLSFCIIFHIKFMFVWLNWALDWKNSQPVSRLASHNNKFNKMKNSFKLFFLFFFFNFAKHICNAKLMFVRRANRWSSIFRHQRYHKTQNDHHRVPSYHSTIYTHRVYTLRITNCQYYVVNSFTQFMNSVTSPMLKVDAQWSINILNVYGWTVIIFHWTNHTTATPVASCHAPSCRKKRKKSISSSSIYDTNV